MRGLQYHDCTGNTPVDAGIRSLVPGSAGMDCRKVMHPQPASQFIRARLHNKKHIGFEPYGVPDACRRPVLARREWCGEYALESRRFTADLVGAKSLNTLKLQVGL